MKILLLILLLTTSLFLESQAQIDKTIKAWCLSLDDQNKELKVKLEIADSALNNRDRRIVLKEEITASHERDEVAYKKQWSAYSKTFQLKDSIITEQGTVIKKTKGQRNVAFGAVVILLLIEIFK